MLFNCLYLLFPESSDADRQSRTFASLAHRFPEAVVSSKSFALNVNSVVLSMSRACAEK